MVDIPEMELAKLKVIELEMLKATITVCEELNITYYVIGGTLLGAVRHKGFIPWDDDIDIAMFRKDYEIFIKKAQALLPDYYFLQTNSSDTNWVGNFSKIRDSRTTFIESSVKNHKINHGVYIDIFPLDYCPAEKDKKKFIKKNRIYVRRISCSYYMENKSIKTILKDIMIRIAFPSLRKTVKKRETLIKSNKAENLIANYCGAWGEKEIMPEDWFGVGTLLEFEDVRVNSPIEYDKYLTQVYGDYMVPPPIEKQIGHHYCEVIDLHKPFTEYV